MLKLNLVSKELKEEIKSKHIYLLLKKMCGVIIVISIFISIILLVAKIILQNNFNKIVEQTTMVTGTTSSYMDKVSNINSAIQTAQNIQNNYMPLSYLIEDLSLIAPDDLTYTLIEINMEQKTLELRGNAGDRDDLLVLKNGMEQLGIFENIESPIQNILQKKNINFKITAGIKAAFLQEYLNNKTKKE